MWRGGYGRAVCGPVEVTDPRRAEEPAIRKPPLQAASPRVHWEDQLARGREGRGRVPLRLLQEVDHRPRGDARDGRSHDAADGGDRGVSHPRYPQPEDERSPVRPPEPQAAAAPIGSDLVKVTQVLGHAADPTLTDRLSRLGARGAVEW